MIRFLCVIIGCVFAFAEVSASDHTFPSRPVTIIVPFAAGGGTDILARMVSQRLEKRLGVTVVVENRAGAGGVVGAVAVSRAPADGYTLLLTGMTTLTSNTALYKALSYNPTEFTPLAMAAATPFILIVNPTLPAVNVKEFVDFAKDQSQPLTYATTGLGAPHHLFMEMFMGITNISMTALPYRGTAPALADVIGGHVPVMLADLGPAIPHIRSGKLRALGVSTAGRVLPVSEIPAIAEDVPGFNVASWQVFVVRASTPEPIIDILHRELKAITSDSEIGDNLFKLGMTPMDTGSIVEMQKFINAEAVRWGEIIGRMGLRGAL